MTALTDLQHQLDRADIPQNPNYPGVGRSQGPAPADQWVGPVPHPSLQGTQQPPRQGLFAGMGQMAPATNQNPGLLGQMFPRLGQMGTNLLARRAQFATNHPFLSAMFNDPLNRINIRNNEALQTRLAAPQAAPQQTAPMSYAPTSPAGSIPFPGSPQARPGTTTAPVQPAGNLITYNYGPDTIRNMPISSTLNAALTAAAQAAGVTGIVINSGGQSATGDNRTGSHRHDDGGAADLQLVVNGRTLDFTNPQDQAIYANFVAAARDAGATGIGAGTDYMGNQTIHVGYGDPAVWGAGGASANAPDWLRTAYYGGN